MENSSKRNQRSNIKQLKLYLNNIFVYLHSSRAQFRKDLFPSAGLITTGEEWYKFRSAVQKDMSKAKSALYYIKDITDIAIELRETLEIRKGSDGKVCVNDLLRLWALETTAIVFLAKRFKSFSCDPTESSWGREMVEAVETFMSTNLQMNYMPPVWKLFPNLVPAMREHDQSMKTLLRLTKDHVMEALAKVDVNDESDQSIIAKFAKRNGKDSPICLAMAIDSLIAGLDTTGNTATILLYHLGKNPQKQEILFQEIDNVIGSDDVKIDEAKLNELKYLKACLSESQRMLPVTVGTARISQVDMVLSGYQVPKGTFVLRGGTVMSNDSANFEEPEKYIPERWLRGHPKKASAHPHASLPFGHGTRNCVGKRFALLEIQILIIKLLQKYSFEYDGDDVDIETSLVAKPDSDVRIKFVERK